VIDYDTVEEIMCNRKMLEYEKVILSLGITNSHKTMKSNTCEKWKVRFQNQLTEHQVDMLRLGLSFAVAPKAPVGPLESNILASVEDGHSSLRIWPDFWQRDRNETKSFWPKANAKICKS